MSHSDGPMKAVLIGTGGWAWQHARVLSSNPKVEFLAVAGRSAERTRARADEFGVRAYTDIGAMLEEELPDIVNISLPNQAHFSPTMDVIEAGFPLFVEKPLVFDLHEAYALIRRAEDTDLFFAINFNHRYAEPIVRAKAAIEEGRLGEIVFASWRFGGEGTSDHPHANLIETQCHAFDQLEYLCGQIVSISAEMTDMTGGGFRTIVLALAFANGAVGSLVGSYDSSYAYPGTHRLEINGTLGRIVVQDTVRTYSFQGKGSETAEVWQAGYFNDSAREFHKTFDRHYEKVVSALIHHTAPPIHAEAGLRSLQLAHAAIESYESGRRVVIPYKYSPWSNKVTG